MGAGVRVTLAPHAARVQTGTPMVSKRLGWEVAPVGTQPDAFAGNYAEGGGATTAYHQVVVGGVGFTPGARYRISDVLPSGIPIFTADPEGPYTAWSPTEICLDAGAVVKGANDGEGTPGVSGGPEQDRQEREREREGGGGDPGEREPER